LQLGNVALDHLEHGESSMTFLVYLLTGWFLLSIVAGLFIGQLISCRDMPGVWNHPDARGDYDGAVVSPVRDLNAARARA
jgi:hypothetical protein